MVTVPSAAIDRLANLLGGFRIGLGAQSLDPVIPGGVRRLGHFTPPPWQRTRSSVERISWSISGICALVKVMACPLVKAPPAGMRKVSTTARGGAHRHVLEVGAVVITGHQTALAGVVLCGVGLPPPPHRQLGGIAAHRKGLVRRINGVEEVEHVPVLALRILVIGVHVQAVNVGVGRLRVQVKVGAPPPPQAQRRARRNQAERGRDSIRFFIVAPPVAFWGVLLFRV